ncbi:MAG: phosphoribosyl-AMP cyclohydrolase [Candidatus Omnitrophota bacterium]
MKKNKFKLGALKFDKNGLIPAVIQDYKNNEVLMVAYMNKESLRRSLKLGKSCFWSRSRKEYWVKGLTSGHFQFIKSIAYDCDMDALLIKVRQIGPACHTGNRSCFYRKIE